jgi:hypothetical protein
MRQFKFDFKKEKRKEDVDARRSSPCLLMLDCRAVAVLSQRRQVQPSWSNTLRKNNKKGGD